MDDGSHGPAGRSRAARERLAPHEHVAITQARAQASERPPGALRAPQARKRGYNSVVAIENVVIPPGAMAGRERSARNDGSRAEKRLRGCHTNQGRCWAHSATWAPGSFWPNRARHRTFTGDARRPVAHTGTGVAP